MKSKYLFLCAALLGMLLILFVGAAYAAPVTESPRQQSPPAGGTTGDILQFLSESASAILTATPPPAMQHDDHAADAEETDEVEFASLADLPNGRGDDGAFYVGSDDAPITIVEFADWACPHCQAYRETINEMIETYVVSGEARFEFRMFPTAGGQDTYIAGKLAECVANEVENGFWLAYDLLYELGEAGRFEAETILSVFSREFDIPDEDLIECADKALQVDRDMAMAAEVGVVGTPGVVVRYLDEDGEYSAMEFITLEGTTFDRGGPPFGVLADVIENADKRVNQAEV